MLPEVKIILFAVFLVSLFLVQNLIVYLFMFVLIVLLLFRVPFASLRKGWIPVTFLLAFTFLSNVLFQHGRILYRAGPILVTEEGLAVASLRTIRVFFMIAGAKILTGTTEIQSLVSAMGKILKPLERLGIPVNDFLSTMSLTMRALPGLRDEIVKTYRDKPHGGNVKGFLNRVTMISKLLIPLFVKSIQSPEKYFGEKNESGH